MSCPLRETPSQTAGPYVHIGLCPDGPLTDLPQRSLGAVSAPGITLQGRIFDGAEAPVSDAVVELWEPAAGHWARSACDDTGLWRFEAPRPPGPAPFVTLWCVARGITIGLWTRVYLPDGAHADDPVLRGVPEARRKTLIATAQGADAYHHDIHLQGAAETVFFDP
ncbi:MAG: protocatechuate 3,4-dioxygenase subunit alpha [Shimia sp.]